MMQIHGECLCGAVRYTARVDPKQVFVCHCSDCQTQSGTAFRSIALSQPGSFLLEAGRLKHYEKRAESGAARVLAFCPECGTSIYGGPAKEHDEAALSLRVGAMRERAQLRPVAQFWCQSKLDWVGELGGLREFERQPGSSE